MTAWRNLFVPDEVMEALAEVGFTAPTPIQALSLPSAIRDRMDIVGAAETGSGKTLAFGIPVVHNILQHLRHSKASAVEEEEECEDTDEEDQPEENGYQSSTESTVLDGEIEELFGCGVDISALPGGCGDGEDYDLPPPPEKPIKQKATRQSPLLALILCPTRELAIQVSKHIKQIIKKTSIKVATVVGGMSVQKQERLLKRCPEIVVATPGRLWELIQEGEPHLSKVESIRSLVIDEADRMVEKGHFQELTKLLDMINDNEEQKKKRQTFVFSATLTLVHSGPDRLINKKKKAHKFKKLTEKDKIEALMAQVGLKDKPKVIDLTRKQGTAETLVENRIVCDKHEKDLYLLYLRKQHKGRTLVFTNSKDCIRRLTSIFTLLECNPLPLHSDMHQTQRLKNLDRFRDNTDGFLIATDVAARGLDIPDVGLVIHYQVPRTTENYVHRSGRTARACKEGLSVMLVAPDELRSYRNIIKTLKRDEELDTYPVKSDFLSSLKHSVTLALDVDKLEHKQTKRKKENSWFEKAAKEMDIDLDEDQVLHDMGDSFHQSEQRKKVKRLRMELKQRLKAPFAPQYSSRYPTYRMPAGQKGGVKRGKKRKHSKNV